MLVLFNASGITDDDRRIAGLPSAPLDAQYDKSSIER